MLIIHIQEFASIRMRLPLALIQRINQGQGFLKYVIILLKKCVRSVMMQAKGEAKRNKEKDSVLYLMITLNPD